jgi:acyl-CoA reductase-like NAD-dependent aldehyde dehydrogenase
MPPGQIATEVAPLGGVKDSRLVRKGSKYGIEDEREIKYLALGGIGT